MKGLLICIHFFYTISLFYWQELMKVPSLMFSGTSCVKCSLLDGQNGARDCWDNGSKKDKSFHLLNIFVVVQAWESDCLKIWIDLLFIYSSYLLNILVWSQQYKCDQTATNVFVEWDLFYLLKSHKVYIIGLIYTWVKKKLNFWQPR